jgi:hypothetical protein
MNSRPRRDSGALRSAPRCVCPGVSHSASATSAQTNFTQHSVFDNVSLATDIGLTQDGRVLVAEKSGLIKVFDNLTQRRLWWPTCGPTSTTLGAWAARDVASRAVSQQPYRYMLRAHDEAIGGTAPRFRTPQRDLTSYPTPTGTTDDGFVVRSRLTLLHISGNVQVGMSTC